MKALTISGAILAVLGLLALAAPVFTTHETTEVARIGDLKLQATESRYFVVPTVVSGSALFLGVLLIGAGLYQRR